MSSQHHAGRNGLLGIWEGLRCPLVVKLSILHDFNPSLFNLSPKKWLLTVIWKSVFAKIAAVVEQANNSQTHKPPAGYHLKAIQ